MAAKIIIFRHGEGTHNVGEFYSSNPSHKNYREAILTDLGRQQVQASVEQATVDLKDKKILAVLSSPLPRTLESAGIAMGYLGVSSSMLKHDSRLIEVGSGDREGKLYSDYQDEDIWFPENPQQFGGETNEQVTARIVDCYRELVELFSDQDGIILAFSHGLPIYMLIDAVLGKGSGFKLPTAGYISLPVKVI